jgi:hypothetical protein
MTGKTKRQRKALIEDQREQVLAVFADYAEHDVDRLFEFLQHCQIDLEPLSDKKAQLDNVIAAHFYVRPGVYDIARLGCLLATFPPIAARIRELEAERAKVARGCT